jgi:hypothetical protein
MGRRKRAGFKVYRLTSDNFEDSLITIEAFRFYVEPYMSTGDWHTHTKTVEYVDSLDGVTTGNDFEIEKAYADVC